MVQIWPNVPLADISLAGSLNRAFGWMQIFKSEECFASFHEFKGLNPPPALRFSKNFMIFEIRPHEHGCVFPYNFFVSQPPAVILSENDIQAPADRTILTEFLITSFSISKIKVKVPKRMNSTTSIRGAIAPAEDITLRCNHCTSHVK